MNSSSSAQKCNSTSAGRDDAATTATSIGNIDVNTLLYHVENTMNCFDKMFHDISPCAAHYDFQRESSKEILRSQLSASQCAAVGELSGYLTEVHEFITDYKLSKKHVESSLKCFPLLQPKRDFDEHRKLCQRVTLLQEYLVNELTHSEQLESRLLEAESQLLKLTDEKNKLLKKIGRFEGGGAVQLAYNSQLAINQESKETAQKSAVEDDSQDPLALLGKFIRKQFAERKYFGLVCNYDKPYYGISYEDGDFEELGRGEVVHNLWEGIVPLHRHNTCYKHAKRLNSLHETLRENSNTSALNSQRIIDSVRTKGSSVEMSGSLSIQAEAKTLTHSEVSDDDNKASENSDVDGHGSNVSATTGESSGSPNVEFSRSSTPVVPDFYNPVSTAKSPISKHGGTGSIFYTADAKADMQKTPPQVKKSPSTTLEKAIEMIRSTDRNNKLDGPLTPPNMAQTSCVLIDNESGEESVEIQISPTKFNNRRSQSRSNSVPSDSSTSVLTSAEKLRTNPTRFIKSEHNNTHLQHDQPPAKKQRIFIDLCESS